MTDEKNKPEIDAAELARKARELAARARQGSQNNVVEDATKDNPVAAVIEEIRTFNKTMGSIRRYYTNTKEIIGSIVKKTKPVLGPVATVGGAVWRGYHWLWDKTDAREYSGTLGKLAARCGRAGVLALTVVLGVQAIPSVIGGDIARAVVAEVVEPFKDSALMATSYKSGETIYLSHAHEIDPDNNIWNVRGCEKPTDCDTEDAIYFRVKPSLMHNAWSAVSKKNPFFIPDHVIAPVAPGLNKCTVASYGMRWRLMKYAQAYPYLLDAKCTPITTDFNTSATNAIENPVPASSVLPSALKFS